MNIVMMSGYLTKDPDVVETKTGKTVCHFSIAVKRNYQTVESDVTDFFNCVAWQQIANSIVTYCHKGSRVNIQGNLQTRSYDDEHKKKRVINEILVERIEFLTSKEQEERTLGSGGSRIKKYNISDFDDYSQNMEELPY